MVEPHVSMDMASVQQNREMNYENPKHDEGSDHLQPATWNHKPLLAAHFVCLLDYILLNSIRSIYRNNGQNSKK